MSNEDNSDLTADKQISDYILHDEIGSGGFAKVVQGTHIPTGEKVAVKIIDKIILFTDPLNLRRVKTEISILKIVRHKNIIKLYEVIETPQKIYLIMEYCEGGELFDYIVQKQSLTERQACSFFHEIIDALEYLHSINIVHRDIKPENLLLDKINKKISIKLIDFGISNVYTMQNLLLTPCGTASYAPPEMHKGEKYYGLLTDIWSTGVVLYAMAFGYLPFCDDDEEININNIIEGNYEIPSSASPELYDLLLHLLDINPITRFDLEQIKLHPWYNLISSDNNRPGLIIGYHKIPVDERIINICETYGYDKDKVKESVINNNYDNNSSIYYIILNKMKTMGIESISDLNSNEYLNYISDPTNIFFGNNKNLNTIEVDSIINYRSNLFLNNNNNNNLIHHNFPSTDSDDSINFKCKKYKNIFPTINIQFSIISNIKKTKNNNSEIINKKEKYKIKNKEKKNFLELDKSINRNDKKEIKMTSSYKNKINHKRKIVSSKKRKNKKRKLNISNINDNSNEEIKKKENIKKEKVNNNSVFQTNKTFVINSKYKMDINNNYIVLNDISKRKESFDKKLTDDIKEKILKLRNPKKNIKKQKENEAQLRLQLKMRRIKNIKNNFNNKKIVKKVPIFNNERKKHTIIHNRNASATQNRHPKNKNENNININYINNNININNIYIKKIREQSSSPPYKQIRNNNSSFLKYQKINKNQHQIINNKKIQNKHNISIITKKSNIEENNRRIYDNNIMNNSVKQSNIKNKDININTRQWGAKINIKKNIKPLDKELLYNIEVNLNTSLTNRRKPKESLKSINFLSFLKNSNRIYSNKGSINQSNFNLKNSFLNDSNTKKNNKSLNIDFNNKSNKINEEKENNKTFINNIKNKKFKKNLKKENNDNSSFNDRNKLSNYISPVHKNNKKYINISNNKKKNKKLSISLIINSTRKINHNKSNSMKHIENNSSSFNYDTTYTQKFHVNTMTNSYREREKRKDKENEKGYILYSNKKGSAKKRKIMNILSLKEQNYNIGKNTENYKSNYLLKRNIIIPKKYKGPIDLRNIAIAGSGIEISVEIESILRKNSINLHRVNPFKIVCWKNSEMIEINIFSISGELPNKIKKKVKNIENPIDIIDFESDFVDKYNNIYTDFYKNEEKNFTSNNYYTNDKGKNNIFYIKLFSQKEKKNRILFELISKQIYNKYSLIKKIKK